MFLMCFSFFKQRDATELEAGRLAKELEKAQIHLTKHQEAAESTRIEFERMSAELSRVLEKLERSEAEKDNMKQSLKSVEKNQQEKSDKNLVAIEAETRQLATERYNYS